MMIEASNEKHFEFKAIALHAFDGAERRQAVDFVLQRDIIDNPAVGDETFRNIFFALFMEFGNIKAGDLGVRSSSHDSARNSRASEAYAGNAHESFFNLGAGLLFGAGDGSPNAFGHVEDIGNISMTQSSGFGHSPSYDFRKTLIGLFAGAGNDRLDIIGADVYSSNNIARHILASILSIVAL